jgi:hypothetical protein
MLKSSVVFRVSVLFAAVLGVSLPAHAVVFDGVDYPLGTISFADEVFSYTAGTGSSAPANNPIYSLGPPEANEFGCFLGVQDPVVNPACRWVSLGENGSLTVKFTDNVLVGSGTTAIDLWIHEVGVLESTFVDISKDGINFTMLGLIPGGNSGFDIDSFGFGPGDLFPYVRVRDDPADVGSTPPIAGADIDAIGAITTVPVDPIPVPAALWLFGSGLLGLIGIARRKV